MRLRPLFLNLILMLACINGKLANAEQLAVSNTFTINTRFQNIEQSASFTLETRPWDGLGDSSNSGLFTLDARTVAPVGLAVTGPTSVIGGGQAAYSIQNAGVDVSIQATLGFVHAPVTFAGIGGNTLFTYPVSAPQTVQLLARYHGPGGQIQSAAYPVTILPNSSLRASATATAAPSGGTSYGVVLTGSAAGGTPPYSFHWDTDNDGQYDDHSAQMSSYSLTSQGGTYTAKLEVTDALSAKAYATARFTVDKEPVANQPAKLAPASDGSEGSFLSLGGSAFQFDMNRVGNGLIVITHGLESSGKEAWIQDMAARISAQIPIERRPNIFIYDWEHDANPNGVSIPLPTGSGGIGIGVAKKLGWLSNSMASFLSNALLVETATDLWGIRKMGPVHGLILANYLLLEAQEAQPRVDFTKPIHLIGHSAGGFVMGEAAWLLKQQGKIVDRVTMLDTPFPYEHHVVDLPNPTVVERYVSSIMGALDWSGTSYLEDTDYRWLGATYFDSIWDFALALTPAAHDKAHEWYRYTVYPDHGYEFLGFYFSPFQNGPIAPGKIYPAPAAPVSFALSAENNNALAASAGTSSSPLSGFQVFGAATESAGIWTIIEGSDAGIFLPVIFPPDATKVKFKYKWSGTADGDFLGVRFGVRPEAFMGLDLAVSRSDFLPAQVEIGLYAGLTDNLVFTLVSRGSPGAVLQLRDIEIVQDDDADRDGLTTAQELAIGTHCQNSDTDGDSIDDMAELNAIPPTNPIAADTDGDGVQDSVEIQAGTDPTNGQSFLRVTDMTKNTGGTFMLRWPSQAGRFYNVQRSADVSFATFDVIGQEMSATPPQNTFVDTSAGSAPNGRFFYRIEVYVP